MKLIIAGSRGLTWYTSFDIHELVCGHFNPFPDELVCGLARGPDSIGRYWALERGIKIQEFPADWDKYGKSGGFIRNTQMAEYADCLLALWDGKSRGTKHMISEMLRLDISFHVELSQE